MKMPCRNPRTQEVVVVIVCIIMLASTAVTVAQRTRGHSHQLACYAQMMTLLDGWTQFAEDNDGQLPSNHPEKTKYGSLSWVCTSSINAPSNLEREIESIAQGSLFPYIGDADTYHCPADTRLYEPDQRAFRSYSI